jgi:chemotaxis protein CheD
VILKAGLDAKIDRIDPSTINNVVNGHYTLTILGGEFAIVPDSDNIAIKTLLGSCVAMMFYDKELKLMGMNHFLLPDATHSNSLKFGLYSVEAMLNEMYKMGARKENIVAKIAGGGHVLHANENRIGDKNVDFALDFCRSEGFHVVSEHTRGEHGRVILLASEFQTFIRVIKNRAVEAEIEANEKILYTKSSDDKSLQSSDSITLF